MRTCLSCWSCSARPTPPAFGSLDWTDESPLDETLEHLCQEFRRCTIYKVQNAEGQIIGSIRGNVADGSLWMGRMMVHPDKKELSQLQVLLDELVELAMHTENSSVRRLSLNVVERLEITEDDLRTDFLDFCLEHMASLDEFSGIQSVSMKLAYRICKFYPELTEEFMRTLEAMQIDYYKPAVKGLRNKILSGKMK